MMEPGQLDMFGGEVGENAEYNTFTDKFNPKKTTDDCYTPANVYDAVADWVSNEYGIDRGGFVRPFWPGADYTQEPVPDGCAVVDNPPFSIITRIVRHYAERGVRFFLFGPTLTLFSGKTDGVCYMPVGVEITYENGAKVNTSFITNLDKNRVRTPPELYNAVKAANDRNTKPAIPLPKYTYPDNVISAATIKNYARYGIDFKLAPEDSVFISAMDVQRSNGKTIFGGGMLLSDRAAADRAAADRAAAEAADRTVWRLSDRERHIIARLNGARGDVFADIDLQTALINMLDVLRGD